jgi:hypothetical protein
MNSKHTPGPWRVIQGPREIYGVQRSNSGGFFLVNGLGREQEKADANLIAAAPELLEALKLLHDAADKAAKATQSGAEQVALMDLFIPLRKAKAAIKKAEGRT